MWTACKLFLFFIVATVLHWACVALFGAWGVSLNVMLVFTLAVCAFVKPEYGYPAAFISGLFLDFFGVKLFGHYAFIFTLCAATVYTLENRLDLEAAVPQMLYVGVFSTLAALCNLLLLRVFAGFSAWNGVGPFVGGIVLNVLLAPVMFWVINQAFAVKAKTY